MTDKEKQYYWTDIESGVTFPCSKEYYETMIDIWEAARPKFKPIVLIPPIITGTKGEI